MKTFIVAVPLFDANMVVRAYQLCAHNSEQLLGMTHSHLQLGESLVARGLELVEKLGIEPFTGGKPLFIDVNQYQIMMDIPVNMSLPFHKLICVLPKDTPDDEAMLKKCATLKKAGMRLALSHMPKSAPYSALALNVDYALLDSKSPRFFRQLENLPKNTTPVIVNVTDHNTLQSVPVPNALFSGQFYEKPISSDAKDISPLKVNALELLKQVNEIDSDLIAIANTIERDPAISIDLLRFINSPIVGMRQRIDSIRAAVAILGQREIKRWTTVVVSMRLSSDKPGEITKLSLVRAKFAENLSAAYGLKRQSAGLFMTGLFSLLDVVLDKPMERAVKELAVDDKVQQALVDKEGEYYRVMEMVYAYERADWDLTAINMIRNDIKPELITRAFIDALSWYKQLLHDLSN